MLVQRVVVTSIRPHPASGSAQRACQLHPTAGQACRCCGSVQPALVRLLRAALCIVLERLILTLGAPCAALTADLVRLLLLWSGLMGSPSSPRSAAIWGAFRCVVPAAHAGRPDAPACPKRFSVSAAARALGWL